MMAFALVVAFDELGQMIHCRALQWLVCPGLVLPPVAWAVLGLASRPKISVEAETVSGLPLLGSVAYPLVIADPSSLFGAVLDVLGVVISDNVTL